MPIADCEAIRSGVLLQPANAASSLVFVLVGGLIMAPGFRRRADLPARAAFAWTLVFVGLGSVGFHGVGGPLAGWAHDVSLSVLFLLVLAVEIGISRHWRPHQVLAAWGVPALGLGVLGAIVPRMADPLNAVLVVPAVGMVMIRVLRDRNWSAHRGTLFGLALLAAGAVLMLASRTGGPLCDPSSLWQGHALWHVFAAAGIGIYAMNGEEGLPFRTSL